MWALKDRSTIVNVTKFEPLKSQDLARETSKQVIAAHRGKCCNGSMHSFHQAFFILVAVKSNSYPLSSILGDEMIICST